MIAHVAGVLAERAGETITVATDGGVGYAVTVPLPVFERLPAAGERVALHTELVVREDGWALFGFDRPLERALFRALLGASGVGPQLALALLSQLGAERTVESIRRRDLAALASVRGVGKKKAERLVLELQDRLADFVLPASTAAPPASAAAAAAQALVSLGYTAPAADDAVRHAVAEAPEADAATLIRRALALVAARGPR